MDKIKYKRLEKSKIQVKKKLDKVIRAANRYKRRIHEIENEQYNILMADQPKLFE